MSKAEIMKLYVMF